MTGMRMGRTSRVMTSWIAVLAILMATLAPSVSRAFAAKAGSPWVEVCSSTGATWILTQGNDEEQKQAPAPSGTHPLKHCPSCSPHANAIAVPAVPPGVLVPVSASTRDLPIAFAAAPRMRHAWVSAPPRAPPPIS